MIIDTPIVTERLILRPFVPADLDDLHAIQSRADVARYVPWEPRSREEVRVALEVKLNQTSLVDENAPLSLAITLPAELRFDGIVIGEILLWRRGVEFRQGEIGFVLHPSYHGRGYAYEAASAILDLAFDVVGLHRVYGRADARNSASAALMRRLGMRKEAHFAQNEIFKGEWGDEVVFAILEDEWRSATGGSSGSKSQ